MSTNVEIHRTVRAISIDLDEAIAFYETFVPTGQNAALIDRINEVDSAPEKVTEIIQSPKRTPMYQPGVYFRLDAPFVQILALFSNGGEHEG